MLTTSSNKLIVVEKTVKIGRKIAEKRTKNGRKRSKNRPSFDVDCAHRADCYQLAECCIKLRYNYFWIWL